MPFYPGHEIVAAKVPATCIPCPAQKPLAGQLQHGLAVDSEHRRGGFCVNKRFEWRKSSHSSTMPREVPNL